MIMEMTDNLIDRVLEFGTEIGRQLPCRESKGMYYAIYRYDGVVYAINFDRDDNSLDGEEITEDQISEYI